jgi:hypothetical protein
MLLTPSEWARHKGFSRQYAAKLIKQGTVRLTNGKVDTVQTEAALAALREPLRQLSSEVKKVVFMESYSIRDDLINRRTNQANDSLYFKF